MTLLALLLLGQRAVAGTLQSPAPESAAATPIPWSRVGTTANAHYPRDGLSVTATADGAQVRCAFQKLDGEVTREGLWLVSTAAESHAERFRVVAAAVGRAAVGVVGVPHHGNVEVKAGVARFVRTGLIEEYRVNADGVRQDVVIAERPPGAGNLQVQLEVRGAKAEALVQDARLALAGSGRRVNYDRPHVTDATGKELTVRMEVVSAGELAVGVADSDVTDPLRIDPTFSDADWESLGDLPGVVNIVRAIATSGSRVFVGGADASGRAKVLEWDGVAWTGIGGWRNGAVFALATSGTSLYVGGSVFSDGLVMRWDGQGWISLGSEINGRVSALAVMGTDLYAGGRFWQVDGRSVRAVAKWDAGNWLPLGSGINNWVEALAVSGTNLYAGGSFQTAGGVTVNSIAKWDGFNWSALGPGFASPGGSGLGPTVYALCVAGSDLYAGGFFTHAGSAQVSGIARWNGSDWSPVGPGVNNTVSSLVALGNSVFAGGSFTQADGTSANHIAEWHGTAWSSLGSGTDGSVLALAASGKDLYAGGTFSSAGGKAAEKVAKASVRPQIQINKVGSRNLALSFNGVLQTSTNLQTWMDYEPQPASPWLHKVGAGSHFFRVRAETSDTPFP